jgi:putative membrane protein
MALADSVPGVSGGTIAFLLGFYEKFIVSLDHLMTGKKEERIEAIKFLFKIGIGWVIGMVSSMLVLGSIFESHIYQISSLFLGFILFSIPIIILEEKEEFKGKYKNLIFTVIGIALVVTISLLNPASGEGQSMNLQSLNFGTGIYVFLVAMVAISAMILPGISGSTLLLIFGLYIPVVTAVKELLHFNLSYLPVVMVFALGCLIGIATVIKLIKKCLEKYKSQTMYTILGLMLGSIAPIILGPTTLDVPQSAMSFGTFSVIFFIIGGVIILGLQKLKAVMSKKEEENK